jgi:hypothetical protein
VNKFAPVANLPIYKRLDAANELGDYHLLIATEVVKDLEAWQTFWCGVADSDVFIIMDNGLIEAGAAADFQVVGTAADTVQADCIVLPDALGDFHETRSLFNKYYDSFRSLGRPLMGVVQGQTVEEVAEITKLYIDAGVEYLSIPRVMVEIFGTRRWLVERARWYGKPIHLLGWSENVEDDFRCAAMPGVMGIDSAVPIWWGLLPNADTMPYTPPRTSPFGKRPADYWNRDADNNRVDMDLVLTNIRWTRRWIEKYAQEHAKAALTAEKV